MAVDDHARDLLTSTTDVTIYVTDVNDNAPEFIRPVTSSHHVTCDATVRLPYTTSADAVVTQVPVTSLTAVLTLLRTAEARTRTQ